ncbi:MAG: thioredoxin family protein [Deferrisomatales bacterium]|nr:thioredoxin family protein [Deferrisomatales bacterium]
MIPLRIFASLVPLCLFVGTAALAASPESPNGAVLGKPTVLVFGLGSRCRYCVQLKEEIRQVTHETGDSVQFHDIRVDRDKDTVQAYRVLTSPTLVFLDAKGAEVFRHQGILDAAQLLERLVGLGFWPGKG